MEEARKSQVGQVTASPALVKSAKLPKLVITKFSRELTDWPRFWNQFDAEIDRSEVAVITKFLYLKELVDLKVKTAIDGLPLMTDGYQRAKNILTSKYGQVSKIVNAYVQNIMALPMITGSHPKKIHEFCKKLLFNVQSLEMLGKLKEISGYVRMSIDKLQGIRGDLEGRTTIGESGTFQNSWKPSGSGLRDILSLPNVNCPRGRLTGKSHPETDERVQGCVYCEKPDHKSVDCKTVASVNERKRVLSNRHLCFNCTGTRHKAADCKCRVGDLISVGPTHAKAETIKSATVEIFAKGTFELHKWYSNVKELETACSIPVSEEETYAKEQLGTSRKEGASLLGLQWNKESDTISVNFPSQSTEPTKRGILSKVAKIYDPLGPVSPITLGGKFLYCDICDAKLAWDAKLPSCLMQNWVHWEEKLRSHVTVPRSSSTSRRDPTH